MLEFFTGSDRFGVYEKHQVGKWTEPDCDARRMQMCANRPPTGTAESCEVVIELPTFSATAEMAGLSRVMGGYHIQADNRAGLTMGQQVADETWPKYQAYFKGVVAP